MSHQPYRHYALFLIISFLTTTIGAMMGGSFISHLGFSFLALVGLACLAMGLLIATSCTKGYTQLALFYLFTLVEGFLLTPFIHHSELIPALLATTVITSITIGVGLRAENLSAWQGPLIVGILGLITFQLVNRLIIPIPFIVEFGLLLFSCYIMYDMNRFKRYVQSSNGCVPYDEIISHVVAQYLNILNLFLHVLEKMD